VAGRALIRVDDSITSPAPVPSGTYNLEGITLAGDPDAPTPTLLQLAEGATFTEFRHAVDNLQIDFAGSSPPCTDLADGESVVIERTASLSCSGTGAFFNLGGIASSERALFYIRDGAYFNDDIGPIIHAPTSGSEFVTYLVSGGAIEGDTISGVVGSTWRRTIVDAGIYNPTQPDFLGTVIDEIPLHGDTHEQGGLDELTVQDLGSGAATAGQTIEADGAGGWNLTTPSSAPAVLTWGDDSIAAAADTRYLTPGRGATASTTDTRQMPSPRAGTLRNLYVRHNSAAGNGNSVVYTVMINGVATGITVTLASAAAGQASDLVNTAAVVQGDRISLRATKALSIGAGGQDVQVGLEFA
jgi:hypothetical protein